MTPNSARAGSRRNLGWLTVIVVISASLSAFSMQLLWRYGLSFQIAWIDSAQRRLESLRVVRGTAEHVRQPRAPADSVWAALGTDDFRSKTPRTLVLAKTSPGRNAREGSPTGYRYSQSTNIRSGCDGRLIHFLRTTGDGRVGGKPQDGSCGLPKSPSIPQQTLAQHWAVFTTTGMDPAGLDAHAFRQREVVSYDPVTA